MRQKNLIWYILAGVLIFLFGSYFFGSNYGTFTKTDISTSSEVTQNLDLQVKVLKDTQSEIGKLKEKVASANKSVDKNRQIINELTIKNKSQKTEIEKLKKSLDGNQNKDEELKKSLDNANLVDKIAVQEKRQELQKVINNLENQIKSLEYSESETGLILNQKEANQEANKVIAEDLQKNLATKNEEINEQLNLIVNGTLILFQSYAMYFVVLLVYWLIFRSLNRWLSNDKSDSSIKSGLRIIFRILWIMVSGITVVYALAGQFSYILTSLGFISAALVFALQNFVASFCVFILISFAKNIKAGDIVKVGAQFECFYGSIVSVGYLYTIMREMDSETFEEVGRTITIPNNFFLTHPIANYTFVNRVVWQTMEIILKEGSDFKLAKNILEKLVDQKFKWMLENKFEYLEADLDLTTFKPKVFFGIGERGYAFTIHLPCRFNRYNTVSDELLIEIMDELAKNNIELAFKG